VVLGLLFIVGRALYFRGYVQAAESRHAGFVGGLRDEGDPAGLTTARSSIRGVTRKAPGGKC
jgi:hypothetical protein